LGRWVYTYKMSWYLWMTFYRFTVWVYCMWKRRRNKFRNIPLYKPWKIWLNEIIAHVVVVLLNWHIVARTLEWQLLGILRNPDRSRTRTRTLRKSGLEKNPDSDSKKSGLVFKKTRTWLLKTRSRKQGLCVRKCKGFLERFNNS
jgi:hypothetical protein